MDPVPRRFKPLSTSGKKGGPRVRPGLFLRRRCPVRRLSGQGGALPARTDPAHPRLLPPQALPRRRCPGDDTWGLDQGDLTPGAAEPVSLFGMTESFATAAESRLNKAAGLRTSDSTVQRTTEAVGTELGHRQQVGEVFGAARDRAWHKDADGTTLRLRLDRRHRRAPAEAPGLDRRGADGDGGDARQPDPRGGRARPRRSRRGRRATSPRSMGAPALAGPLRRRLGPGGVAADQFHARGGGDPGLLPRVGAPGGICQGLGRGRDRGGQGPARGLGAPPEARRGGGDTGGVEGVKVATACRGSGGLAARP